MVATRVIEDMLEKVRELGYLSGWSIEPEADTVYMSFPDMQYQTITTDDAYMFIRGMLIGACNRPKPPNITEATAWDPDRTPIRAGRGAAVRYGVGEAGDPSDTSFSVQFYNDQLHIMGVPYALIIEPEVSNSIRIRMRLP